MFDRIFALACDVAYIPGLFGTLNSIYTHHGNRIPVFIYERDFSAGGRARLKAHPLAPSVFPIDILPHPSPGLWEAKQQVMAHCLGRARCVFLLDADIVLTSGMDDVFALAAAGKIVGGRDGGRICYDEAHRVYGDGLPGTRHYYMNTGAVCLDVQRHWDLVALWAFTANYGAYSPHGGFPLHLPGHGDQGIFNALVARLGKLEDCHFLPHRLWHECGRECTMKITEEHADGRLTVLNVDVGQPQRLLHSTGPKWWTPEGEAYHGRYGDKLRVYQHFGAMNFTGKSAALSPA